MDHPSRPLISLHWEVLFLDGGTGLNLLANVPRIAAQQPLRAEENSLAAINKTGEVLLLTSVCSKPDVCSLLALVWRWRRSPGQPLHFQRTKFKAKTDRKMKRKRPRQTQKQRFLYLSIQSGTPYAIPPWSAPQWSHPFHTKEPGGLFPRGERACLRVCARTSPSVCVCNAGQQTVLCLSRLFQQESCHARPLAARLKQQLSMTHAIVMCCTSFAP